MIYSKLFNLLILLKKTEFGRASEIEGNHLVLLSRDPEIMNKLNSQKFMQGFLANIFFLFEDENAKIIHIFQKQRVEDISIEYAVETEFNNIFKKYSDKLDFMCYVDNETFMIECNDLELVRTIYLGLKNFDYVGGIGNKHIFSYLKENDKL